jgi:hypothetical protein
VQAESHNDLLQAGSHLMELHHRQRHALRRQLHAVRCNASTLERIYGMAEDTPYRVALSTLHSVLGNLQDGAAARKIRDRLAPVGARHRSRHSISPRHTRALRDAWGHLASLDQRWAVP